MMYYDLNFVKKQEKEIFMKYKKFNIEKLFHKLQSDVFIKQIKTFEIDFDLSRAFVMIFCESTYNQKLNN